MTDLTIANEIKRQLGNKASMMMGAKNFVGDTNSLQFRIGRNSKSVNFIKITLTPADLYDIEFGRIHGMNYTVKASSEGIYSDMMHSIIENETGMYLSF